MSAGAKSPDFSTIVERPKQGATREQLSMLYTRYHLASRYVLGKDVLEVGCGTGIGLGLLAARAASVVGGDIEEENSRIARETYCGGPRITIRQLDAESLSFPDLSFDLVILFEALYYLARPDRFFLEARRVLRPGGVLLISTVNCKWTGFNPSPFSTGYFEVRDLAEALSRQGFDVSILVGFPDDAGGVIRACVGVIRRIAVRLHLIPMTMRGKEWLKRLFYGRLTPIPRQLTEGMFEPEPLVRFTDSTDLRSYRVIYAIARLGLSKEVPQ